jgi:hypothetical protein
MHFGEYQWSVKCHLVGFWVRDENGVYLHAQVDSAMLIM